MICIFRYLSFSTIEFEFNVEVAENFEIEFETFKAYESL